MNLTLFLRGRNWRRAKPEIKKVGQVNKGAEQSSEILSCDEGKQGVIWLWSKAFYLHKYAVAGDGKKSRGASEEREGSA